jgi:hypothetical protein
MQNADRRLFVVFYEHNSDTADSEIFSNTELLKSKPHPGRPAIPTETVSYPFDKHNFINTTWFVRNNNLANQTLAIMNLERELDKLTDASELILRGHGNVMGCRLSMIGPEVLARSLIQFGLKHNCRINITGCDLGRNKTYKDASRMAASAADVGTDSFAQIFQKTLWAEAKLCNEIHARTSVVTVDPKTGRKQTKPLDGSGGYIGKQPQSKIIFKIDQGGAQTMTYAY